jgi:hypothetical protein
MPFTILEIITIATAVIIILILMEWEGDDRL